jgi:hypothetical protein
MMRKLTDIKANSLFNLKDLSYSFVFQHTRYVDDGLDENGICSNVCFEGKKDISSGILVF